MVRLFTPEHRRYSDQGIIIPNVELNEGIRPWIGTEVAPYLPLQLLEEYHNDHYVVLTGKAVALDSLGFVTLAGLRLQIDAIRDFAKYRKGGDGEVDFRSAAPDVAGLSRYDATDVTNKLVGPTGVPVAVNEPVVWNFLRSAAGASARMGGTGINPAGANQQAADEENQYEEVDANSNSSIDSNTYHFESLHSITVGYPVGVAPYSYYRSSRANLARPANGANPAPVPAPAPWGGNTTYSVFTPTGLRQNNYHKQGRVAILCDYACEYPWVTTAGDVLLEGMSVFKNALHAAEGVGPRAGDWVTIDSDSNLTLESRNGGNASRNGGWEQAPDLDGDANDATLPSAGGPLDLGTGDPEHVHSLRLLENKLARWQGYRLGQVIRVNAAHVDTAYLNKVKSRFESSAGADFTDVDRLPGTATSGKPWNVWAAGRTGKNPAETGSVIININQR